MVQESAERARRLREILEAWPVTNKIKELHIWSHSIGAGLFLGYQDPSIQTERGCFIADDGDWGKNFTFDEVRETEVGALFTDDLLVSPFLTSKTTIAGTFATGASRVSPRGNWASGREATNLNGNGR